MHGGVGDGSWGLTDLASRVPRPMPDEFAPDVPPFVQQCLWSDPADSDADMARGVHHNASRDRARANANMVRFGLDVTCAFCARESRLPDCFAASSTPTSGTSAFGFQLLMQNVSL